MAGLTTYRSPNGQTFQVAAGAEPVLEPFFNRLNQVYPQYKSAGGYAHRPMRTLDGRNLGGLSTHATGYTLDVKAPDPVLRQMAQEFPHLKWGGKFSHYDPVHFEFGPTAQKYGELPPLNPASLLDPKAAAPVAGPGPQPIAGGGAPMTPTAPITPFDGMMPADVQKHRKLAQLLAGQATDASPVGHWTQALARVVQGGVGGMHDRAATEGERAGQASIATMMAGNPSPQAMMANPYTMDMGKQLWLAQAKSRIKGPEADPSNVREWQHFNKLSPEDQARYLNMKRADKWLDTGMEHVRPNPALPGGPPIQSIPKAAEEKAIATKTGENIAKTRAELPEAKQRLTLLEGALDRLNTGVETLERRPGLERIVGGLWQAKTPNITPDAVTAQTDLDNLKQKISGTVLQSMRDMSKTGGAVGAVTEREWPRLENMLANLEQAQDLPSFKRQLGEIKVYVQQVKQAAREAYEADLRTAVSGPQSRLQGAGPPAQAVEFLRTQPTPEMKRFFDQKYGPGAANAVLGGR